MVSCEIHSYITRPICIQVAVLYASLLLGLVAVFAQSLTHFIFMVKSKEDR